MDIVNRTLREMQEEVHEVLFYIQRWWNSMDQGEQLFTLGIVCASCLLIGILGPSGKPRTKRYNNGSTMSLAKQFIFAAVILLIFTFGIDSAIDNAI